MQVDLFAFLDGASPWWWVAFAAALGAVEMLTFTYFVLWLALDPLGNNGLWLAMSVFLLARGIILAARYPALERRLTS